MLIGKTLFFIDFQKAQLQYIYTREKPIFKEWITFNNIYNQLLSWNIEIYLLRYIFR